MVPCGFVSPSSRLLIGPGVLIDSTILQEEIVALGVNKRFGLDFRCTTIEPKDIKRDKELFHLSVAINTTGTGCGPANSERAMRKAKQVKTLEGLQSFLTDVPREINKAIKEGKQVIVEGTQGYKLSLFFGSYPYVTSKDTTASSIAADVGIGPKNVGEVILVFRTFPIRVGNGHFPTEISTTEAKSMGIVEYGSVTGRPRRVGKFDYELMRDAVMVNAPTQIALTGIDLYDSRCRGITEYSKLTKRAIDFISSIEEQTSIPVSLISTGPEINEMIDLRKTKGYQ
jgi:adenylosuccinate synthase